QAGQWRKNRAGRSRPQIGPSEACHRCVRRASAPHPAAPAMSAPAAPAALCRVMATPLVLMDWVRMDRASWDHKIAHNLGGPCAKSTLQVVLQRTKRPVRGGAMTPTVQLRRQEADASGADILLILTALGSLLAIVATGLSHDPLFRFQG